MTTKQDALRMALDFNKIRCAVMMKCDSRQPTAAYIDAAIRAAIDAYESALAEQDDEAVYQICFDGNGNWVDVPSCEYEREGIYSKRTLYTRPTRKQYTEQDDALTVADYEEVLADHRRLVRELDEAINGSNAAKQASLCDIVAQVKRQGLVAEQDDECTRSHPHEDMTEECVIKTDIARLNNHLAHLENHDGVSIQLQISPQTILSKDISGVSREAGVRIQSFLNQAYEAIDSNYNKAARDKEAAKLHMVEPDYRLIGCAKSGSHDVGGGHKTIYCYGCKDTAQGENLEDATEKWNNKQLASLFTCPAPKTYTEHDIDEAIGSVDWANTSWQQAAVEAKKLVMRFAGSVVHAAIKRVTSTPPSADLTKLVGEFSWKDSSLQQLEIYRDEMKQAMKAHLAIVDVMIGDSRIGRNETIALQEIWRGYKALLDLWDSGTKFQITRKKEIDSLAQRSI